MATIPPPFDLNDPKDKGVRRQYKQTTGGESDSQAAKKEGRSCLSFLLCRCCLLRLTESLASQYGEEKKFTATSIQKAASISRN